MRTTVLTAAVLLLSGCATVEQMRAAPSAQLCYAIASGKTGGIRTGDIYQELASRGDNCEKYAAMTNARLQSDAASMAYGQQLLQAAQPKPAPTPLINQTNCTSRVVGNTVQTNCW
jgi:hypothetical protein